MPTNKYPDFILDRRQTPRLAGSQRPYGPCPPQRWCRRDQRTRIDTSNKRIDGDDSAYRSTHTEGTVRAVLRGPPAILLAAEVQISMDSKGRALDNIFTERLWRSVKYEEVYRHDYAPPRDAYHGLPKQYFTFYNQERLHQALGYTTPASWFDSSPQGKPQGTLSKERGLQSHT